MNRMDTLRTHIRNVSHHLWIEERVALLAMVILVGMNAVLYQPSATGQIATRMIEYFGFGEPFYVFFFLFLCGLYAWKFCWRFAQLSVNSILHRQPIPSGSGREMLGLFVEPLRRFAPLAVISASFYTLLGNLSFSLRLSGRDELLASLDRTLTGGAPFIALANAFQSPMMVTLLKHAYLSLSIVMSATLIILFSSTKRLRLYRQLVLAFIISLMLAFPFFVAMPCQDPYHTFVSNTRGRTHSPAMQAALLSYAPSDYAAETTRTIAASEESPEKDNAVPISCFPSMHATWSMLSVYFLFLLFPASLIVTLPWITFLLMGGITFGQHYLIDYVMALPIAAASVAVSAWLLRRVPDGTWLRREQRLRPPAT